MSKGKSEGEEVAPTSVQRSDSILFGLAFFKEFSIRKLYHVALEEKNVIINCFKKDFGLS